MVDAVLNTLFLQRQQQVMRDMERSDSNARSSLSPTSSKQIKRENGSAAVPVTTSSKRPYTPETPHYQVLTGVPKPAVPTKLTAPVHIDIGGTIYTSSLENLTKYPSSRLAKLFSGELPIILDTMKQHYFIDRDGPSFRYVLQFLRCGCLTLPIGYDEIDILLQESKYYELHELTAAIEEHQQNTRKSKQECLAISICPELGERIYLSGRKLTIEESFPELRNAVGDSRNSGWALDNDYVIRFPINGFCKLNSIQVLERVLNNGFSTVTSSGGGVEGQQFTDYLFVKDS
ncbi:BTB/POZ domain-containing protein kctd15-like [Watersipora subatra]|uniref:BTB/POZ domain-containing protein kctd15-like n=1 Tax=Watersipora subatra TaxID=2589382 RepID=UPI00355B64B5